jgi:arylsulfatase A-like enzyme
MLSNFLGLCELARVTGENELLEPVLIAWEDIVAKRLYITGSTSSYELFQGDHELPNPVSYDIGEGCVTTTWIQLNWQLLRLTGEAKYGNEIERALYNHLAGAQHPRGDDWCYYTALEGRKPYDKGISCCHSSGPRAMALATLTAYWKMRDGGDDSLAVSTLETSRATLELGGQTVTVEQQSGFPREGRSELTLRMERPARFALRVRIPEWATTFSAKVDDEWVARPERSDGRGGWATLPARPWNDGDRIAIEFDLTARRIPGTHGNAGKAALAWGPFVLAYDESLNPGLPVPAALGLTDVSPPITLREEGNDLVFETRATARKPGETLTARFTTFADAGASGGRYRVWLRAPGVAAAQIDSLLIGGRQSCSRQGDLAGPINDDQPETVATTHDGRPAREDWFAVTMAAAISLDRVVFAHGKRFPNGGWFDTSQGRPRVEVQREPGGPWEVIGELRGYPATTATNPGPMGGYFLKPGREFTMKLASPVRVVAVRVIGTPACGNDPKQAFASCAELQAFGPQNAAAASNKATTQAADGTNNKPNVLFILADDLGWGDLGCYGHRETKTPNLDRLAQEGTLFTQFYVNASVCSPSRCAFFTGQYPARHRIHGHYATPEQNEARGMSQRLEPSVPNVAALLKRAGYATAHVGKWHLSTRTAGTDIAQYGFDFVGTGESGGAEGPAKDPYFRAKSTGLFVDEVIRFIKATEGKPFYVQLWTLVPHATLNPTEEQMKPYSYLRAGGRDGPHAAAAEIFSASVTDLDAQIGRLMRALDELGLADDTLILFSSDNGPEDIHIRNAGHSGVGSAGPFRGRKRSLYEGGIRVPGIVRWPGKVPGGRIDDTSVVAAVDWLPTVCKLAGVEVPAAHKRDGEDAADILLGGARARRQPLFWEWRFRIAGEPFHHSPMLAIRDGDWKLLMNPDGSRVELYEIKKDPTQLNNDAEHHPDVVKHLSDKLLAWSKELPPGPADAGAGQMNYGWPGKPQGDDIPRRVRPARRAAK